MLTVMVVDDYRLYAAMRTRYIDRCSITPARFDGTLEGNKHAKLVIVNLDMVCDIDSYAKVVKKFPFFEDMETLCVYLTQFERKQTGFHNICKALDNLHDDYYATAGFAIISTKESSWRRDLWGIVERYMENREKH